MSPADETISLRTFNRNFAGRTGTNNDQVYLVSPAVAVASALTGEITDPRDIGIKMPEFEIPLMFLINDNMIIPPIVVLPFFEKNTDIKLAIMNKKRIVAGTPI